MQNSKVKSLNSIKHGLKFIYSIPLVFICGYVALLHKPLSTISDHLLVISLIAIALLALDAKLYLLNVNHKLIRTHITLTRSSFLFFLLLYYTLVIISINAWGKVITKEIIYSYTGQVIPLLNTLGVSSALIIMALISLAAFCIYVSHKSHQHYHWEITLKHVSKNLIVILLTAILTFAVYHLYSLSAKFNRNTEDPFFLTMHAGRDKQYEHSHNQGQERNPEREQQENIVRASYTPNLSANKKNIIILLSDALRPDHMSLNGYYRDTTPHLKAYNEQGLLTQLTNVKSTCGETACSHASLFSSRYVHELPLNMFSMQEVLDKHGYETKFLISGNHIHFNNMRDSVYRAMDEYYDGSMQEKYYFNDDRVVIDKANSLPEWNGTPTFIHFHLLSNHVVGQRLDQFNIYKPHENYAGLRIGNHNQAYINHYDNGVTQADWVIHTLIQTLKSKKYLEDAIVIIIADHGESLGEHNKLVHTNSVYEQLLNIPLIFLEFGHSGLKTVNKDKLTSIIDIAPTILTVLNMPIPTTWKGIPIQSKKTHENVFFKMLPNVGFYHNSKDKQSIKYWRNVNSGEEFMFNVNNDPDENKNIIWRVNKQLRTKVRNIYSTTYDGKTQ